MPISILFVSSRWFFVCLNRYNVVARDQSDMWIILYLYSFMYVDKQVFHFYKICLDYIPLILIEYNKIIFGDIFMRYYYKYLFFFLLFYSNRTKKNQPYTRCNGIR